MSFSLKGYAEYPRSTLHSSIVLCVSTPRRHVLNIVGPSTLETLLHCLVGESSAGGYPEYHRYMLKTALLHRVVLWCSPGSAAFKALPFQLREGSSAESVSSLYCFTLKRLREAFPMPRYAVPPTICDHLPVWRKEKQQYECLLQLSGGLS